MRTIVVSPPWTHRFVQAVAVLAMGAVLLLMPNKAEARAFDCRVDYICVDSCSDPATQDFCSSCYPPVTLVCEQYRADLCVSSALYAVYCGFPS